MPEVLLDILLVLVVSGALRKILQGVMTGMRAPQPSGERRRSAASVHMERDPVCGTFVVPGRAVSITVGGEHVYFCSKACCDRYRAQPAAFREPHGHSEPPRGGASSDRSQDYVRGRTA